MDIYDIFFSICLGLFIGGLILSVISFILAEMSVHDHGTDHVDHVDHIDHIDHVDHLDHIDHIDHVDHMDHIDHIDHVDHLDHIDHIDHVDHLDHIDHIDHLDHPDHIDHIDHIDHLDHIDHVDHADYLEHYDNIDNLEQVDHDQGKEFQIDSRDTANSTPAPFMLLLSSGLLVFGISGIASYYIIVQLLKFLMFIIAPIASILTTKLISKVWKRIAISMHYPIASTQNLLGKQGEVILRVDYQGGVIKIISNNPMKYEKLHVMPFQSGEVFEREEKVYIVGVRNKHLLVDKNTNTLRNKFKNLNKN